MSEPEDPGPVKPGVPAGAELTVHEGNLVITHPGAIVDGLDISGFVWVGAGGVTIRNCVVRGGAR